MAWGERIEWKIWRASRSGVRVEGRRGGGEGGPVPQRPLPLALLQEARTGGGKVSVLRVVSIWKTLTPLSAMSRPMRQLEECSSEAGASMKDSECRMVVGVVVVAQALVAGQAGGHALVAAVHGHQVDVDVDEQVAGGRPLVDLDVLALVGVAEVRPGCRGPRRRAG